MANSFAGQTVIIDNGSLGDVYGNSSDNGNSPNADPNNNVLIINGGGSVINAYGALSDVSGMAVTGNSVFINGGTADSVRGGESGSGNAYGNSVTINGSTASVSTVRGGESGSGNAYGNSVTINDGTATFVYGGFSANGNAYGNSVTINNGTVGSVYSGYSVNANASGNSVFINGGMVTGDIIGGYANDSGSAGKATNNTVTLAGSPSVGWCDIYGGKTIYSGTNDVFTGNTLNVWNYTGTPTLGNIRNFEFYNFVLPTTQTGPVLDATAYLGDGTKNSVFTVSSNGGTAPWQPDKEITLISNISGNFDSKATGQHGATLSYDWTLAKSGNDLVATLDGVSVAPGAKSLSEGFLAGTALLNQTGDLIVKQTEKGDGIFFDMAGNWSRYNTKSHIDLAGLSLLTGYSRRAKVTPGCLTYGAFFEYGTGSYDTFNSFGTVAAFRNNGNANHFGGGVLGRLDFRNCFYADGSLRAGGLSNHFKGGDLKDAIGTTATFDSKTAYYSIHLGTGRIYNFSNCASLDLYGRYFWTHQQGDTLTLSTNDPVRFSDVNSHRLRFGSRLAATNRTLNPYVGAAYEHEFDGEARAATYGYGIDAPTLRGSTGIGELGLDWKPCRNFSIDFGLQGYTGTRQGGSATLMAGWRF